MEKPKRKYELTLELGGDSMADVLNTMRHIVFELSNRDSAEIVSGSPSSGYILNLKCNPEQTHEKFFQELDEYIKHDN